MRSSGFAVQPIHLAAGDLDAAKFEADLLQALLRHHKMRQAQAVLAAAIRDHRSPAEIAEARRNFIAAKITAFVATEVRKGPRTQPRQAATISKLLRSGGAASGGEL